MRFPCSRICRRTDPLHRAGQLRLMLLGSPPDMVRGAPPYRTRPPAYPVARIFCLALCCNITTPILYPIFSQKTRKIFAGCPQPRRLRREAAMAQSACSFFSSSSRRADSASRAASRTSASASRRACCTRQAACRRADVRNLLRLPGRRLRGRIVLLFPGCAHGFDLTPERGNLLFLLLKQPIEIPARIAAQPPAAAVSLHGASLLPRRPAAGLFSFYYIVCASSWQDAYRDAK